MLLTPTEFERLTPYTAAELARKRRAKGLRLNHPEAEAILEGAREGREPLAMRPQWDACGEAKQALAASFVSRLGTEGNFAERPGLRKRLLPVIDTRNRHAAQRRLPAIMVDPQTFEVHADGVLLDCAPSSELPLIQRYMLR